MKKFGNVICGLSVLFILWGFLSWCDIVADNCDPNPTHSQHNLFVVMTEWAK